MIDHKKESHSHKTVGEDEEDNDDQYIDDDDDEEDDEDDDDQPQVHSCQTH